MRRKSVAGGIESMSGVNRSPVEKWKIFKMTIFVDTGPQSAIQKHLGCS